MAFRCSDWYFEFICTKIKAQAAFLGRGAPSGYRRQRTRGMVPAQGKLGGLFPELLSYCFLNFYKGHNKYLVLSFTFTIYISDSSPHRKMAHDPRVYSNPMAFDPERFIAKEGKEPELDPRELSFGFGRR